MTAAPPPAIDLAIQTALGRIVAPHLKTEQLWIETMSFGSASIVERSAASLILGVGRSSAWTARFASRSTSVKGIVAIGTGSREMRAYKACIVRDFKVLSVKCNVAVVKELAK
jgi:hypothetical protein